MRAKPQAKKRAGKSVTLARPGDPLVTNDGEVIHPDPVDAKEQHARAREHKVDVRSFRPTVRRAIRDMPAQGDQLKAVSCVMVCTIAGMTDRDIAAFLNVDTALIERVKTSTAYTQIFEWVKDQFINANSDMIQARIAAYGVGALNTLAEVAFNGREEKNKLKAADSLLDRNEGIVSLGATKKNGTNTLRIIVEEASSEGSGVKVELNGEEIGV